MKMIFKIAKTEIKQLFYSPIAWFLLIVFFVQCGIAYSDTLDNFARRQELGGSAASSMKTLTSWVFGMREGIYAAVLKNLFLYIPLLTMGLISRETSSGTVKLLYSSPVTVGQIVLGKFVSMMLYSLCMLGVLVFLMVLGCFNIQSPDIPLMLSSLLGVYLLLCTYSAIGLFMSSLTTYQVLAGIGTFVMIGFLSYVGNLWQRYDFVRDLTYFLSLTGRTENMLRGLISTKDLVYFVVIIYIFLSFAVIRLKASRESRSVAVNAAWYTGVMVSALVVGYLSSRPAMIGYFDATDIKSQSLAPKVREIVEELGDDKLEVVAYSNLLGNYYDLGLPEFRNRYLDVWEPYVRYKPDISFRYVNYYDSSYDDKNRVIVSPQPGMANTLRNQAEAMAKNFDYSVSDYKTPEEMRKIVDLRPELTRFVMQLNYKGRSTFLRVFNDMYPFPEEPEFAAAFKRLQQAKFPKIVFLTGNLERSIYKNGSREYRDLANDRTFRYAFINHGFDMDTVSLDSADIPADADVLVVADPRQELSPVTLAKLNAYIAKGGNLLIAGEPGKQPVINPLLRGLGVQLMDGIIAQPDPVGVPDRVIAELTAAAGKFSKEVGSKYRNKVGIMMPGVAPLLFTTDSGFNIKPLLTNNPALSFLRLIPMQTDSAEIKFDEAAGDQRRMFPLALALTRQVNGKEQRIVVSGDADFLSNEVGKYHMPQAVNFIYNSGLFKWLSYDAYPIDASRPDSKDRRLNISADNVKKLRIVIVWVLPAILLLIGSVLLLRRKRK